MSDKIELFCKQLDSLSPVDENDDIVSELYELTDMIQNEKNLPLTYETIFKFLENNADADIGSPGPLVHLIETSYPNYVLRLLESLETKPTYNTIHMLHRILNADLTIKDRQIYMNVLKSISENESNFISVRTEANDLYNYQTSQNS